MADEEGKARFLPMLEQIGPEGVRAGLIAGRWQGSAHEQWAADWLEVQAQAGRRRHYFWLRTAAIAGVIAAVASIIALFR
jgi:hypothetical protein